MIIRKPYAFLIKNFRKIHVILLIIGLYVFYQSIDIILFVQNYLKVGLYDYYENPITKHISWFLLVCIVLMFVGSFALLLVLRHKKKPWKFYLIPTICYLMMFFSLRTVAGFFNGYTQMIETANLRLANDLVWAFFVLQIPSLIIFAMRLLGIDIKRFHFNDDLNSLDLSDEDREEIEISLSLDFSFVKRNYKKFLRYLGYFYKEHKIFCVSCITFCIVFFLFQVYTLTFVTHRVYKQGQLYNTNGYSITVNNSYITNLDYSGNVITDKYRFVVVELSVKNNAEARVLDTSNFHLKSGFRSYTNTEKTYQHEFEDLGKCYSNVKRLQNGEEITFILVFKVDKLSFKSSYVFYYQEKGGINKLRKIKLKIKNLNKMEKPIELKTGDFFEVPLNNKEDIISFDSFTFSKSVQYRTNQCLSTGCLQEMNTYDAPKGYKILSIEFASDTYEAKNMIDFLTKYGKIIYKDSKGNEQVIDVDVAVNKKYLGKIIFIKVPEKLNVLETVVLKIVIRNQEYDYNLI